MFVYLQNFSDGLAILLGNRIINIKASSTIDYGFAFDGVTKILANQSIAEILGMALQ